MALICAAPCHAEAQSIFQFLFGNPPSVQTHPQTRDGRYRNAPSRRYRSSGKYTTMCVRLCDGFYFPIQSQVSRRNLHHQAQACKQRCNTGAKLFYMPANSTNIDNMVDLSGRRYADLENAYVYRKRLIGGCSCRPAPWSQAERARHSHYHAIAAMNAAQEREEKLRSLANNSIATTQEQGDEETRSDVMESRYVTVAEDGTQTTVSLAKITQRTKPRKKRYARKNKKRKKIKKANSWTMPSATKYRWPGDS